MWSCAGRKRNQKSEPPEHLLKDASHNGNNYKNDHVCQVSITSPSCVYLLTIIFFYISEQGLMAESRDLIICDLKQMNFDDCSLIYNYENHLISCEGVRLGDLSQYTKQWLTALQSSIFGS